MKLQVDKTPLTQILQKIQNITEKKSTMPILANTLIAATDRQAIEFSATDLELSVWTRMDAEVEVPGRITVSARKLLEIVRELPKERLVLEALPNSKLSVRSGRSQFELATIPSEDFPHISFYQDVELKECDGSVLQKALGKTLYGIPMEEDPFSVAGLFLHPVENEHFRFVSSDGHRLACFEVSGDALPALEIDQGIIIPRKGVQEILRVLEREEKVSLGKHENCLILRAPDTFLSTQLLEAEFPEYQLIIPEERPFHFSVEWESLYLALKRVSVLTNQKWRHVRFIITSGTLELESGSPEIGNANDILDIEYEGEGFTVAFNVRYLLEAVQAMESPKVRFEWVDDLHGGVFVGPDDPGYLGLIMPMVI